MQHRRIQKPIQYFVGVPIFGLLYYGFALAFFGHMQGLVDSGVRNLPWYYSIPNFFLAFPLLTLMDRYFSVLRPALQLVFDSPDNAALFIVAGLQALFWGVIAVFCFRFVRSRLVTSQPDSDVA